MAICECGCGGTLPDGRRFLTGHHRRLARGLGRRGLGAVVDGDVARIPLRRVDGTVRAWAILDASDLGLLDDRAFSLTPQGYAARNVPGPEPTRELLHRLIMGLAYGERVQVDHVNRDKLDNRRSNLQIVSSKAQGENRPRPGGRRRGRHRFKGVAFHAGRRKPWQAQVRSDGRMHSGGYYATEEEAGEAARHLRERLHTNPSD